MRSRPSTPRVPAITRLECLQVTGEGLHDGMLQWLHHHLTACSPVLLALAARNAGAGAPPGVPVELMPTGDDGEVERGGECLDEEQGGGGVPGARAGGAGGAAAVSERAAVGRDECVGVADVMLDAKKARAWRRMLIDLKYLLRHHAVAAGLLLRQSPGALDDGGAASRAADQALPALRALRGGGADEGMAEVGGRGGREGAAAGGLRALRQGASSHACARTQRAGEEGAEAHASPAKKMREMTLEDDHDGVVGVARRGTQPLGGSGGHAGAAAGARARAHGEADEGLAAAVAVAGAGGAGGGGRKAGIRWLLAILRRFQVRVRAAGGPVTQCATVVLCRVGAWRDRPTDGYVLYPRARAHTHTHTHTDGRPGCA